MNICELVWLVVGAVRNAATFDLLVNIPIAYIINLPLPWATGVVATLLTLTACAVNAFSDLIFPITEEKLVTGLATFFKYFLPWIGLRYLWNPGNWFLYCFVVAVLLSGRCRRTTYRFNGTAVTYGCFYSSVVIRNGDQYAQGSVTTDYYEWNVVLLWRQVVYCWSRLVNFWRQTVIYRFLFDPLSKAGDGTPTDNKGLDQASRHAKPCDDDKSKPTPRKGQRGTKLKQCNCCR